MKRACLRHHLSVIGYGNVASGPQVSGILGWSARWTTTIQKLRYLVTDCLILVDFIAIEYPWFWLLLLMHDQLLNFSLTFWICAPHCAVVYWLRRH